MNGVTAGTDYQDVYTNSDFYGNGDPFGSAGCRRRRLGTDGKLVKNGREEFPFGRFSLL
jgi:hypothetical protein